MKNRYLANYLLLAALAILIFFLSEYIIWFGDPIIYRFHFGTGEPIRSLGDILTSQYVHYFSTNGRIWAHVLCQGFSALWGQTAFAVCNAVVYVLFVLLLTNIVGMTWKNFYQLLICTLTMLFFTDIAYNPNCQIGYVWTSTVTLVFIIRYFRAKEEKELSLMNYILLFLLSLFAGNGNEAIAIGTGGALIIDFFKNYRKVTKAQIVMIAGFGISGLLLCLSPGIILRASNDSGNFIWTTYRLLGYSRMLYVLIFTIAVLKWRGKIKLKEFMGENLFYVSAWATLLVFNYAIGIGWLSGRQLFGVELFSAILTLKALKRVNVPRWATTIFAVVVIAIYAMKIEYLHMSNDDLETLREEVAQMEDFKIYKDFHHYTDLVHPNELNNDYGLRQYAATSFHSDMLNFRHFIHTPEYAKIAIYPTVMKEVLKMDDRNFASRGEDGYYLVVQEQNNPRQFVLKRYYNIFGLKWPKEPFEVEFYSKWYHGMEGLNIIYTNFYTPLVENGEIIMK